VARADGQFTNRIESPAIIDSELPTAIEQTVSVEIASGRIITRRVAGCFFDDALRHGGMTDDVALAIIIRNQQGQRTFA
jgi:hypothetical protein